MDAMTEGKQAMTLLERRTTLKAFVDVINHASFEAEIDSLDLGAEDDDGFEFSYYNVSVSSRCGQSSAFLSIRIDLDERQFWVTADDGYYVIGRKRSLEGDFGGPLVRLLVSLLSAD